ncbi:hypothetical protein HK101_011008, partial [Irineochytrium annulatum]
MLAAIPFALTGIPPCFGLPSTSFVACPGRATNSAVDRCMEIPDAILAGFTPRGECNCINGTTYAKARTGNCEDCTRYADHSSCIDESQNVLFSSATWLPSLNATLPLPATSVGTSIPATATADPADLSPCIACIEIVSKSMDLCSDYNVDCKCTNYIDLVDCMTSCTAILPWETGPGAPFGPSNTIVPYLQSTCPGFVLPKALGGSGAPYTRIPTTLIYEPPPPTSTPPIAAIVSASVAALGAVIAITAITAVLIHRKRRAVKASIVAESTVESATPLSDHELTMLQPSALSSTFDASTDSKLFLGLVAERPLPPTPAIAELDASLRKQLHAASTAADVRSGEEPQAVSGSTSDAPSSAAFSFSGTVGGPSLVGAAADGGSPAAASALTDDEERDVGSWSVADVSGWLRRNDFSQERIAAFTANNVDGARLLSLSDEEMSQGLGMTSASAREVLRLLIT